MPDLPDDLAALIEQRVKAEVERVLTERSQPPSPPRPRTVLLPCEGCGKHQNVAQDPRYQNQGGATTLRNELCPSCKVKAWEIQSADYRRRARVNDAEADRILAYDAKDARADLYRGDASRLRNQAEELDKDIRELSHD